MASEGVVHDFSITAVPPASPECRSDTSHPDKLQTNEPDSNPHPSSSPPPVVPILSVTDGASCDLSYATAVSQRSSDSQNHSTDRSMMPNSARHSTYSMEGGRSRRRGYVRPQGTDFAASARSRESVLSLGSIAHLQYYFARTGLLDGKGAQLARKKAHKDKCDRGSPIMSSFSKGPAIDYTLDMGGGSPVLVGSPVCDDEDYYTDDLSDVEGATMLPPTVSTYNPKTKLITPPPTVEELKERLTVSLNNLTKSLSDARALVDGDHDQQIWQQRNPAWFEHQGFHILDVATLAIRSAKDYYTAHEQPGRLALYKSERELRAELLATMEVLQKMATRRFIGGMRAEEIAAVESWIDGVHELLQKDDQADATDRAERANWLWAKPDWHSDDVHREIAFMESMLDSTGDDCLPPWAMASNSVELPTQFLLSFRNGLRLVKLHNAAVRKSRRRFGSIPMYHADTMKPYRCADNLRYWVKAAELRWEIKLHIDPLGIVYNADPGVWVAFETAIFAWCRKVRTEMTAELEE
jgi:hypothetical protein